MSSSRDYWKKRENEALKNYIKDEKEYDKQVKRIYQNQFDAIQKEIESFYAKYASSEGITLAEAKKRVSKLDIEAYERKAKKYVAEKNFSKQANEEMRLYNATMKINRLEMLKANIGLELIAGHEELNDFMGGILKGRTEEELKRQAGILGKTIKNNAALANAIPNASFHNATFSDRIWMYQDLLKNQLSGLLQTGLIQGKNPRVLARELKKTFQASTGNAERLMRTELARVQTEAQKQSFERNGFEMYEFIANSSCCDICKSKDGKHFKVADMQPGENAAPMHPNCRCSVAAWEDSDDYEAWLDYLDKGGTTEEWNAMKNGESEVKPEQNVPKYSFNPAKTIEEAEEFAKQFVDVGGFGSVGMSYAGVHLDVANEINRALATFYSTFDIPHLGGLAAPAKNTKLGKMVNAHAAYSPVIKSLLLDRNKTKKTGTFLEGLNADKVAINDILDHPEKYDFNKLSNRLRKVIEASKKTRRSIVAETIPETIYHELGHHLERSISKSDLETIKAGMGYHATDISGYAADSLSEYIAESVASYMKGEDCIDPEMRKILDGMRKNK